MKRITKAAAWIGVGLMIAAITNVSIPLGLAAMGVWSFCFVYDEKFRGVF